MRSSQETYRFRTSSWSIRTLELCSACLEVQIVCQYISHYSRTLRHVGGLTSSVQAINSIGHRFERLANCYWETTERNKCYHSLVDINKNSYYRSKAHLILFLPEKNPRRGGKNMQARKSTFKKLCGTHCILTKLKWNTGK